MLPPDDSDIGAWALYYRTLGWSVFPVHSVADGRCTCGNRRCNRVGKHPAIPSWAPYQIQPPSADQVRTWWQGHSWNIGLATGAVSGVVVLDEDGAEGRAEIARLGGVPETPTAATGKGHHMYFRHPGGGVLKNFTRRVPGLDFRGDGGFAILPPSRHASGHQYQWLIGPDAPLADPPAWLLGLLHGPANGAMDRAPAWVRQAMNGVEEGQRNAMAARLAGYFLRTMDADAVRVMLHTWNRLNRPPLSDNELDAVIDSITKRDAEGRIAGRNFTLESVSVHVVSGAQDPPTYHLRVNGVEIVLSDKDFFNYQSFRRAALNQLGFVPCMKTDTQTAWIRYVNSVLADTPLETVYLPEEAGEARQLWEVIRHELARRASSDEGYLANRQGVLLRDGRIYANLPWLHQVLRRHGLRVSAAAVWEQIAAHGGQMRWVHARDESGKRHTIRAFELASREVVDEDDAAPAEGSGAPTGPAGTPAAEGDADGEVF